MYSSTNTGTESLDLKSNAFCVRLREVSDGMEGRVRSLVKKRGSLQVR